MIEESGFPFVLVNNIDLERRIKEEGQHLTLGLAASDQSFGAGTLFKTLSGGYTVFPGWDLLEAEGEISALKVDPAWAAGTAPSTYPGRGIFVYFNAGSGAPTNFYGRQGIQVDYARFGPLKKAITEGSTFNTAAERISASDGDTHFYTKGVVGGILMPKGWNKPSDCEIPVIGDSISQHSAFTSGTDVNLWTGMIRSYFANLEESYTPRIINKAKGGSNSINLVNQLIAGELDFTTATNIKAWHVMIMTNDVLQAFQANNNNLTQGQISDLITVFIANITTFVNSFTQKYGNKYHLILAGAPPVSNTVQEGALVQVRNALRSFVNTYNGGTGAGVWDGGAAAPAPATKVWFLSYGATSAQVGVYSATDNSKYIETVGNRIHPNASGNVDVGARAVNFLLTHNIR